MNEPRATLQLTPAAVEFIETVQRLRPRIAVFDCDGTLWDGDTGEHFMYWELDHKLLPESVATWIRTRYKDYKAGKVNEDTMCGEMVTINDGVSVADLQREAQEFFKTRFSGAIFAEMRELTTRLAHDGCQLWAVSSTNDWVIRAAAPQFGIPAENVLAACVHCNNGTATGRLWRVPTDEDKAVAIREVIGEKVDAVFGNSVHDLAMLSMAGRAFAINPNPDLHEIARQRGWDVYFPMGTAARR